MPCRHGQVDVPAEGGARLEKAVAECQREVDVSGKAVMTPMPVNLGLMPRWCERQVDAMHRGIEGRAGDLLEVDREIDLASAGIERSEDDLGGGD